MFVVIRTWVQSVIKYISQLRVTTLWIQILITISFYLIKTRSQLRVTRKFRALVCTHAREIFLSLATAKCLICIHTYVCIYIYIYIYIYIWDENFSHRRLYRML